jgi:uncharacterized lipoprotein NlpE involved in copper resistance
MTHRHALLALALASLALAACKREAEAPSASVAAAPAEAAESAVISEVDHASPASAAPGFDAKAFAGTYAGDLPCTDCPGIDTTIAFTPEGGYTMSEVYRDDTGSSFATKGSWRVGEDGKTLQLDPEDKGERDHWLEVASPTELRALDRDGKPLAGGQAYTLRRR